ncbi:uncharacterized protein LOC120193167 [Hibiscus syriacus]|uniref:uncharacterized protein LOC120193167 n=1 Tax=Hibiscus syriacus TaxID=106335 RepID=UPI001923813B|nr:uncharacterized protein LOC120193167 [Hibiscus syriacus]
MCTHEGYNVAYVILDIFIVFSIYVTAIVDTGSTHSYICYKLVQERNISVEDLEIGVRVSSTLGLDILVNKVHRCCPIELQGEVFLADSIDLPFREFDVILGMDWLTENDASLRCKIKQIKLHKDDGTKVVMTNWSSVVDTRVSILTLEDIHIVREFSDVFLEEFPGLSPESETEFSIEIMSGSAMVSIAPHRMALTKLKELKNQILEFLDKGFI